MTTFIKVRTSVNYKIYEILINPAHIVSVEPTIDDNECRIITFAVRYNVFESLAKIEEKLNPKLDR